MKICVSIDSESYTTLTTDVVSSVDEAVTKLLEREDNPSLKLSIEEKDGSARITLEDGVGYFVVAQVFDVAEKKYAAVWWHAYDGVDFDLKGMSNDFTEAKAQLDFYVTNFWVNDGYDVDDYENGDTFALTDTGNEWECIEIVDLSAAAKSGKDYSLGTKEAA